MVLGGFKPIFMRPESERHHPHAAERVGRRVQQLHLVAGICAYRDVLFQAIGAHGEAACFSAPKALLEASKACFCW